MSALAALWPEVPSQRCTVHKHRNLLAHAPQALHEEITADDNDMIYAESRDEVVCQWRLFLAKWRLKCRAVADSLEEVGERLFTFTRLPPSQWRSARTTNAIECLHEGVQAPDQDPDRAAVSQDRRYAVLVPARIGADHHAQSRRLAEPRRAPCLNAA